MKKIRVLNVSFENEISPWEVGLFRGAVIKTTGRDCELFHNHQDDGFRYSYPLIQYKRVGKKPLLICFNQGVDEIHHFFSNKQEGILLGDRPYELKVDEINLNSFNLDVSDKSLTYEIYNWLPLSQKNYSSYKSLKSDFDRIAFLEKILIGNILSFAKGMDWKIEEEIKLRIDSEIKNKPITIKGVKRDTFNVKFTSNVNFPNNIGLGKNTSLGFGTIKSITK